MARKDFWKSDWFLGVAVAVVVLVISRTDFVQSMERKGYDLDVRASKRMPSDRIAVIALDENSIANIGRWPSPRDLHAIRKNALRAAASDGMPPIPAASLDVAVLGEIRRRAASIGYLNSPQDVDGAIRTKPLLLANFDQITQERFATGDQMAKAIRQCAESFGAVDVAL